MSVLGLNFRETEAFVTDSAGHSYFNSSDAYPVTRGGKTFGIFGGVPGDADEDDELDPRIAGFMYGESGTQVFQIDIIGTFDFRLAAGRQADFNSYDLHLLDDYTDPIWTGSAPIEVRTLSGNLYADANNDEYSAANWPSSNMAKEGIIINGPLIIHCDAGTPGDGFGCLNHISWDDGEGGGGSIIPASAYYRRLLGI